MLKGWIKKIIRETVETAKCEAVARAKQELEITSSVEKIIADEVKKYVKAEIERVKKLGNSSPVSDHLGQPDKMVTKGTLEKSDGDD